MKTRKVSNIILEVYSNSHTALYCEDHCGFSLNFIFCCLSIMSYESTSGSLGKSYTNLGDRAKKRKNIPWYKEKRTIYLWNPLIILCLTGIIIGSVFGSRYLARLNATCQKSNETTICFCVFFDFHSIHKR
jgi:hypothetical protein